MLVRIALSSGIGLGLAFGSLSAWSYLSRARSSTPVVFRVDAGEPSSRLAERLEAAGAVDSAWLMGAYLATLGNRGKVMQGPHLLPPRAAPRTIAACLAREPKRPTVEVVFPEGFDHLRVAERLEQRGVCAREAFVAAVRDRKLLDSLAITGPDAEGYLFPATYRLHVDAAPSELLSRLVDETRTRLRRIDTRLGGKALANLALSRGYGEREVLTLASMVEKEARADEERPLIASVFYNRLDSASFRPRRMLQSDPTAAYGCMVYRESIPSCREFQHKVLPAMLRDVKNPYNTYRHPGLPPGPIANPGEASIESVLQPATTDYLFFVADGAGRHRFSRTLDAHEANVRGSDAAPP
ncbi:MAG: endolytic transglycosylase MltG [Polyangiaceae bacterium]